MPIESCTLPEGGSGFRWGSSGECYVDRKDAERQAAAIHASGYGKAEWNEGDHPRDEKGQFAPDFAANLAFHLQEKTGSVLGRWEGKMNAKEQRALFGRYIGNGTIVIDGTEETVSNRVSVAFGQDYDYRNVTA